MKSILSYPDRGSWGDSKWRGNGSGHIQKDLINFFKPSLFVDVCEGSGTSRDVCIDLNIPYIGLDIHQGFDFTHDYVLRKLPKPADIVFSHPPYHNMISYADNINDTSRCASISEFLAKSQLMLLNQREATISGGIYCSLIGDMRKNGVYSSFQADFINMMPKNELLNVIIKAQYNMNSNKNTYSGNFIPIVHEYLLIWKRKEQSFWQVCVSLAKNAEQIMTNTWRNAVRVIMMKLQSGTLKQIYAEVESIAHNLIANNANYKAKIRQILQKYYTQVERGIWSI